MTHQPPAPRRVLAIWLDGFDMGLADSWQLEHLGRLASSGAVAVLDAGETHRTGLAGEHLATGLHPDSSRRSSPVTFEADSYRCYQSGAWHPPAFAGTPVVVLDPCYFDLVGAPPEVQGLTDWGSHDPGGPPASRPLTLGDEVRQRFGACSARMHTYGTPWASAQECTEMARVLAASVETRGQIASWLLGERLPDWQIALIGVAETHGAIEGMFHGVDESPSWRAQSSRAAAADGLREVYTATDALVGRLVEQFPDAVHVVFSMHGMGPHNSDVPSMLLIGELLRRWSGTSTPDGAVAVIEDGIPQLPAGQSWGAFIDRAFDPNPVSPLVALARRLPRPLRAMLRRAIPSRPEAPTEVPFGGQPLDWMPVMRHQPYWHTMRAFAIPSYYDGRVRLNVRGRESSGIVEPGQYHQVLDELELLLSQCRDPITAEPVVHRFERPFVDPMDANATDVDLLILWRVGVYGVTHPALGTIGPVPPRRTGGHSSPIGRMFIHGPGIKPIDLGVHSSFDVLPTVLSLAGASAPWPIDGEPLMTVDA